MTYFSLTAVAVLAWSAGSASDFAIVPDPTLTPGAVRTTDPVETCEQGHADYATGRGKPMIAS